ncbi:hypothetical protein CHU92_12270 [Flavobacterium cyanobacteriorum]|uniref:Uncharacterized protein n=1 Tax=Flavobacterium cyanobacteriorum TaxID=2022802 RepID=A0A255YXP6_9FLAO|nr:hypothetical protein [Flavobacterium cyanobacteriorum]OYQ34007.1 hypothetical protein CHU92_12270 [Flavobacterium cyanobacteriorum]
MKSDGNIEFIVRGSLGDSEISPSNISLSMLSNFSKDISDLLNSIQELKKEDIVISVVEGSFKIKAFIALAALNIVKADIETLSSSADFSSINEKRSKIFEDWYRKTKVQNGLEFEILPENHTGIKINSESVFKRTEIDIWIEGEHYLYGIITDMGGSQKPNIHFTSDSNQSYLIDCTKDDILNEKENRVYHPAAIRVLAKQNLITGEIKEPKFASFIEYNPVFDENILLKTIEKGRNAWSDVPDHVEWVRNLRLEDE